MPISALDKTSPLQLTGGQRVYLKVKRGIDFILSGVGLVVLSPVFLGIVLAI